MSLLSSGQYKIFNTKYIGQDADLLGGQPTAAVAGHHNNTHSSNMVWNLTSVRDQWNQFTLTNAASSAQGAYASVDQVTVGAGLHGSTSRVNWTVIPMAVPGEYWIVAPVTNSPIPLVWSLFSGADATQITLQAISSCDISQIWTFVPWDDETPGYMAKRLDELD